MRFKVHKGKSIAIETSVGVFLRGVIKTHFITAGEDYIELVNQYVKPLYKEGDILSINGKNDAFYDIVFPEYENHTKKPLKDPTDICDEIFVKTGVISMIVDIGDFRGHILGKSTMLDYTDDELLEIISDNPSGEDNPSTPFVLIRKRTNKVPDHS